MAPPFGFEGAPADRPAAAPLGELPSGEVGVAAAQVGDLHVFPAGLRGGRVGQHLGDDRARRGGAGGRDHPGTGRGGVAGQVLGQDADLHPPSGAEAGRRGRGRAARGGAARVVPGAGRELPPGDEAPRDVGERPAALAEPLHRNLDPEAGHLRGVGGQGDGGVGREDPHRGRRHLGRAVVAAGGGHDGRQRERTVPARVADPVEQGGEGPGGKRPVEGQGEDVGGDGPGPARDAIHRERTGDRLREPDADLPEVGRRRPVRGRDPPRHRRAACPAWARCGRWWRRRASARWGP